MKIQPGAWARLSSVTWMLKKGGGSRSSLRLVLNSHVSSFSVLSLNFGSEIMCKGKCRVPWCLPVLLVPSCSLEGTALTAGYRGARAREGSSIDVVTSSMNKSFQGHMWLLEHRAGKKLFSHSGISIENN